MAIDINEYELIYQRWRNVPDGEKRIAFRALLDASAKKKGRRPMLGDVNIGETNQDKTE
tara:strand:- start:474 stop:650 length:177 start_codon:yes stop_codon:yes gene_type:complete